MANIEREIGKQYAQKLSAERYEQQAKETTALELKKLLGQVRVDNRPIDHTIHFKKQFISIPFIHEIKLNKGKFVQNFRSMIACTPLCALDWRLVVSLSKMSLYIVMIYIAWNGELGQTMLLAAMLVLFALLFATQKSIWIRGHRTEQEWEKKLKQQTCLFWADESSVIKSFDALTVVEHLCSQQPLSLSSSNQSTHSESAEASEEFFCDSTGSVEPQSSQESQTDDDDDDTNDSESDMVQTKKSSESPTPFFMTAVVLGLVHASLPRLYPLFHPSTDPEPAHSHALSTTFLGLAIFTANAVLFSFVCLEFLLAARHFFEKKQRLYRFSILCTRSAPFQLQMPRLKLSCKENLFAWAKMRDYLQDKDILEIAYFQVILSYVLGFVSLLSVSLLYRFLFKREPTIWWFDIYGGFYLLIFGVLYLSTMMWIGCEIDRELLAQLKYLTKVKWKLDKLANISFSSKKNFDRKWLPPLQAILDPNSASTPVRHRAPQGQFPGSQASLLVFNRRTSSGSLENSRNLNNSSSNDGYRGVSRENSGFSDGPTLREIVMDLQDYYSSQTRVTLLGFKVDYQFLLKVLSLIGAASVSHLRDLISNLSA